MTVYDWQAGPGTSSRLRSDGSSADAADAADGTAAAAAAADAAAAVVGRTGGDRAPVRRSRRRRQPRAVVARGALRRRRPRQRGHRHQAEQVQVAGGQRQEARRTRTGDSISSCTACIVRGSQLPRILSAARIRTSSDGRLRQALTGNMPKLLCVYAAVD